MSRREQVDALLDMIGFRHNTVQVLESNDGTTMMYPNYFTAMDVDERSSDELIYLELERIMREHRDSVNDDLILLHRFGMEMGYGKEA
jgi:hypothetical protein